MAKAKKADPTVIAGDHLTVTTHPNGQVELSWDWDALTHEVRAATLAFESKQERKAEKAEKKTKAKKSLVKETEAKVTKTRAKKADEKKSPTKDTAKKATAKKATVKVTKVKNAGTKEK